MALEFKLSSFEGPLDLLLTLIEKNKVDIYDIPIAMIADQYMEYVAAIEERDLEVLSDFLLMASTLLEIKSRMLLPKEEDENGEEIDPRTELVERLIEYREYKLMAGKLNEQYHDADAAFFRDPAIPKEVREYEEKPDIDELLKDVTVENLTETFRLVMERREDRVDPIRAKFGNIKKDPVRISDKLSHILDYGKTRRKFSFRNLLENQETRMDMVVTFLACLELIHVGQLLVTQESIHDEIELEWNEACDHELTKDEISDYD